MAVQAVNITDNVSTIKMQSRKRSSEKWTNESPPKRKKNLLSPYSKVAPAHSLRPSSTYKIMRTPVPHRMNTGHFSAWGVEDGQILYYMQKTGDSQSVGSANVSTPCRRASKSPRSHQNSSKNCAKQNKKNISSYKVIQTKKKHDPCARWTTANSKNSKTFCSHFSERLINMPEVSFPGGPDDCNGKNAPNSSGMWTCDTCLILNKDPAVRCRGCETLKYGVGLERQWIPAVDINIDTGCEEIQITELSADTCTAATHQITDGAEESPPSSDSLMTDVTCPHPQVALLDNTSSITAEEKRPMEILPTGTECTTILLPAQINPAAWLPLAFTGSGNDEKFPEATSSPPKPTQQNVLSGNEEQQKCEKGGNSLNPEEPKAIGPFRFQASLSCITFPYVFGPPPIYTTCSSAVPLTLNVPALTRSNISSVIVPSPSFQTSPFLLGSCNEMSNSYPSFAMFGSSGTFPSVFGQTGTELFPVNTGGANSGITVNPLFPSAGVGFQFSGNLVPDCNFGCSTNNAIFRFEASNNNQSISHEFLDVTTETPRMLNSVQPSGISHRKIKMAVRKRRPKYASSSPNQAIKGNTITPPLTNMKRKR